MPYADNKMKRNSSGGSDVLGQVVKMSNGTKMNDATKLWSVKSNMAASRQEVPYSPISAYVTRYIRTKFQRLLFGGYQN